MTVLWTNIHHWASACSAFDSAALWLLRFCTTGTFTSALVNIGSFLSRKNIQLDVFINFVISHFVDFEFFNMFSACTKFGDASIKIHGITQVISSNSNECHHNIYWLIDWSVGAGMSCQSPEKDAGRVRSRKSERKKNKKTSSILQPQNDPCCAAPSEAIMHRFVAAFCVF